MSWHVRDGKWRANVGHHGRLIQIGSFDTIDEAEAAVVAARLRLFTHNDIDRRPQVGAHNAIFELRSP